MNSTTPISLKIQLTKSRRTLRIGRDPYRKHAIKAFPALILAALALSSAPSRAADYYVDPATGSMSNPGTSSQPWSNLEAVFAQASPYKVFSAGDKIYLKSGYHGYPQIKSQNGNGATIQPATGATPLLKRIVITGGTGWTVTGVDICPEHEAAGTFYNGTLVNVTSSSSNVTLSNNRIRHGLNASSWTLAQWQSRAGGIAILLASPNSVINNNTIENVGFGVQASKEATNVLVAYNTITNFLNDGLRGLGDYGVFEYNTVQNAIGADANHDDFFQSWSTGVNPVTGLQTTGYGKVTGLIVRNNKFLEHSNPNAPLAVEAQGIGCFDGMYENFVIENNLIVCSTPAHGISLYGAINCKVVNNTIVRSALSDSTSYPRVNINPHKTYDHDGLPGTPNIAWPTPSSGNLVRNNIVSFVTTLASGAGTQDYNLVSTDYAALFTNYATYDFTSKATSPAVNAGNQSSAPLIDIDGNTRTAPYDIGAYEYGAAGGPLVYEGFDYAPTTNVSTAPDSSQDYGFLGTTWTGTNDIVAPGLTYSGVTGMGNALTFVSNVGSLRTLNLAAFTPDDLIVDSDSVTRVGKPGTTLWLMFLMRINGSDPAATLTAGLNLNGATYGGTTKLRFGDIGSNGNWGVLRGSFSAYSTVPLTTGVTRLVVVRMSWVAGNNNDEVDLYINPPLGPNPPATPSATLRGTDIGPIDSIEVKANRETVVDEIAIARSWSDF